MYHFYATWLVFLCVFCLRNLYLFQCAEDSLFSPKNYYFTFIFKSYIISRFDFYIASWPFGQLVLYPYE
jgi:hypothetical protein